MKHSGDTTIAVIGGGIFGASIAYHLSLRGARNVVVLERMEIASAASSQAAGLLFHISPKRSVDPLSRATFSSIPALERQLAAPLDFRQPGTLRLAASEESRSRLEALFERAVSEGIAARKIPASRLHESVPWLTPDAGDLAVHFPDDGYIDPHRLTMAYFRAAAHRGVRMLAQTAVDSLRLESGRIAGVATSRGPLAGHIVVVAAGAWSNCLTEPVGVALPTAPTRSHYWTAAAESDFSAKQPMVVHMDAGVYTRPEASRLVIGVQEAESKTFDHRDLPDDIGTLAVTEAGEQWDALAEAAPRISRFLPSINDLRFERYVAGLSTYTPDGQFILGAVDAVPGLYVASGCCGSGIMASGGIGEAMADLILDGECAYDLSPFRPDRFGKVSPSTPSFRARCARARSGKAG